MTATKPHGYDDRFVAPLEPSRRGAHRARVSPLLGALPVVAVVAVVVVVILLAWTVLGGDNQSSTDAAASRGAVQPTASNNSPATQVTPDETVTTPGGPTGSGEPTSTSTASPSGTVDKVVTVTVLNSTTRDRLAARAATKLVGLGWTQAAPATTKYSARPTTVYYATADQKATAEALVADLGAGTVKRSASIAANGLTVILGTDYPV